MMYLKALLYFLILAPMNIVGFIYGLAHLGFLSGKEKAENQVVRINAFFAYEKAKLAEKETHL